MSIARNGSLYRVLRNARNYLILKNKKLKNATYSSYIHPLAVVASDLVTEDYVFIGPQCEISPQVIIGRYSMLARGVAIVGGDHKSDVVGLPMQFSGRPRQLETKILRDVWIGRNAIILRGVTIGEGAVVAAGAVVTRDVAPYTVVAGIPARFLKNRFNDSLDIERHSAIINGSLLPPNFAGPRVPGRYEK